MPGMAGGMAGGMQHGMQHGMTGYDSMQTQHLMQRVMMLEQMFALQQQTNEALLRALGRNNDAPSSMLPSGADAPAHTGNRCGSPQGHGHHKHGHAQQDDDIHVVLVDDPAMSMHGGGGAVSGTGSMARRAAA